MVSKTENKNKNNDYKDFSDGSDSEVDNGYSGFNLIPDKYDSDEESVYSENNNVGYEITPDGDTYEEYIKNNKEEEEEESSAANENNDNGSGDEKSFNDFGDFVDFKSHSEQFHNLDSGFNNDSNDNIEEKLKNNPMLKGIDFSEYFPKADNDPFSTSNDLDSGKDNSNNNSNNIYSERNEKGHMVLERNKLFPPDHVAQIQECMKNIKLDYKPMWTNFITEDKWLGALKNKITPTTSINPSLNNNNNNNNNNSNTTTPINNDIVNNK